MARKKDSETVKFISELPSWFSLAKYDPSKSLDALGWHHQFSVRRDIFLMIGGEQEPPGSKLFAAQKQFREAALDEFSIIQISPILEVPKEPNGPKFGDRFLGKEYSPGVRDMTIADLRNLDCYLSPGRREYSRRAFSELFGREVKNACQHNVTYPSKKWMYRPIEDSVSYADVNAELAFKVPNFVGAPIVVDTGLSDAALKLQFEEWLNGIRKKGERPHAPKKSQYERKDFDTWIDYAVLPFIDLTLWELVSGMKVPRRVMALALSDSGIISEKKIEQTIEPLAIRFLNQWAGFGNKPNQTDPLIILRRQAGLKLDR